jgi:uncharacterized protein YndB with AHSA1/START domain
MTTKMETAVTTQVYQVFIKATPEAIWEAITSPEWSERYGFRARTEYDLQPGGTYKVLSTPAMLERGAPEVLIDGEVVEADPPHRLVQTWRALWTPELVEEGYTRVTWQVREERGGMARLTVTHELEGAPLHAEQVLGLAPVGEGGGGWSWILSDLKTLLESGEPLI